VSKTEYLAAPPVIDLDAPVTTYRISVDVDMCPADMTPEQAGGLFIAALETAYTVIRGVRINQCSELTPGGLRNRTVSGETDSETDRDADAALGDPAR
jgi:hypothetical protein